MDDSYEIYPILHRGKVYNLITAMDMSFVEIRSLINYLEEHQAFESTEEDVFMGPGKLFSFVLSNIQYEVDVFGYEIVIYSRVEFTS